MSFLKAIPESENGFQQIEIADNITVHSLTIPTRAKVAIISIEADDNTVDKNRVVRLKENGTNPTILEGIGLGDNDVYRIEGIYNLANFRIIAIESGMAHYLNVQYYE